jgi:hypothetical protein
MEQHEKMVDFIERDKQSGWRRAAFERSVPV